MFLIICFLYVIVEAKRQKRSVITIYKYKPDIKTKLLQKLNIVLTKISKK